MNDYYLRQRIIDTIKNPKTEFSIDTAIDDFVSAYDSDTWCRGWFKHQIEMLVKKALSLKTQKTED